METPLTAALESLRISVERRQRAQATSRHRRRPAVRPRIFRNGHRPPALVRDVLSCLFRAA